MCAYRAVQYTKPALFYICTFFTDCDSVLKCKTEYLLTSFPLSEGLVSVKHIKIIMQSLLTQEQCYCSIIPTEQHHPILFINPISHNVPSAAWSF